jgi:hypothetical protein
MAKTYCHAYPLGTAKLILKSGFFPLSAPVSWMPGPWASCYLLGTYIVELYEVPATPSHGQWSSQDAVLWYVACFLGKSSPYGMYGIPAESVEVLHELMNKNWFPSSNNATTMAMQWSTYVFQYQVTPTNTSLFAPNSVESH